MNELSIIVDNIIEKKQLGFAIACTDDFKPVLVINKLSKGLVFSSILDNIIQLLRYNGLQSAEIMALIHSVANASLKKELKNIEYFEANEKES